MADFSLLGKLIKNKNNYEIVDLFEEQMNWFLKCRGQTYDGASAMAGSKTGVQARIKDQPKALFNHCHGHLIILACAENVRQTKVVSDALDTALEITKLVKKSPHRDTKLEKLRRATAEDETESPNIRLLCSTRWTVRTDAMNSILKNYNVLFDLWEWSIEKVKDAKMKARIRGVDSHMRTFDCFYGLSLGECLLRNADNLSAALQAKDLSAAEGKSIASKTMKAISLMRSEESFDLFWEKVLKAAREVAIEEPRLPRQRRVPARFETGNAPAKFAVDVKAHYRQMFYQSIDNLVTAISERYDTPDFKIYNFMQSEQLLLKCVKRIDFKSEFDAVTAFYNDDFHNENLRMQLQSLAANFEWDGNLENLGLSDITDYFKSMSARERSWLAEVQTLLKLVLIMPATNTTSERSFSSLRRVKTYLRSTMKQERLNSLMILHVHKERVDQLKLTNIASEFAAKSQRSLIFGKFK